VAWFHAAWPVTSVYLAALWLACATRPGLPRALRVAWTAFAVSSVAALGADATWIVGGADSLASSVLSLVDTVATGVGLVALPVAAARRGERARAVMDLGLVMLAATVALWDTVLRPVLAADHADGQALFVAAISPLSDMVLLTGASALLVRKPAPAVSGTLLLVAASMLTYAVLDFVWAAQALAGTYVEAAWIDLGWLASRLLWMVAAVRQLRGPSPSSRGEARAERAAAAISAGVPVAATAVGFYFVLQVVAAETADRGTWGTGVGAATLCALVLVRQTHGAFLQARLNRELAREQAKAERLLRNVLPEPIARRLTDDARTEPIADSHREVTVLFADLVGFTLLSARTPPERLIAMLDTVFTEFDAIADRHGLEKIKTIGDAYMAAAGVPEPRADHARAVARAALAMRARLPEIAAALGVELELRIGLHTGPVVAGVIGARKFIYDLWGDTVNTASRMESHGIPGEIHVSEAVAAALRDGFTLTPCGIRDIKGKGPMTTFLLTGERAAPAADAG
jgi:class 3 adenylate cyclase